MSAAAHTLSTSQMPSHTHSYVGGGGPYYADNSGAGASNVQSHRNTGATGGGGSHSHGMSGSVSSTTPTAFAPKYIDVIICAKD